MTKRKIKSAYSRTRVQTKTPIERRSKVVQSEKNSSDINNIMAKANQTGQLPLLMNRQEVQPLPDAQTYQESLNQVVFAQQSFERLPSELRTLFHNDPIKMLTAIEQSNSDPKIKTQLQELGILDTPQIVPTEALKENPTLPVAEPAPVDPDPVLAPKNA